MDNFKEELNLMLDKEAIIQVDSIDRLKDKLNKLLDDENYRAALVENTNKLTDNVEQLLEDYTDLILSEKVKIIN